MVIKTLKSINDIDYNNIVKIFLKYVNEMIYPSTEDLELLYKYNLATTVTTREPIDFDFVLKTDEVQTLVDIDDIACNREIPFGTNGYKFILKDFSIKDILVMPFNLSVDSLEEVILNV